MPSIILPIQKSPFDRIFNYQKHYEFRKKLPLGTTQIYLYLCKVGILGKLDISKVELLPIDVLVDMANLSESNSGFKLIDYYKNSSLGCYAAIAGRHKFNQPIPMPFVPQSYVYLDKYPLLKEQLTIND